MASRTVDFPESPGPIKQHSGWRCGIHSSSWIPLKFSTESLTILTIPLDPSNALSQA